MKPKFAHCLLHLAALACSCSIACVTPASASGFVDIPLESVSLRAPSLSLEVNLQMDNETHRLTRLTLKWGDREIEVPPSELKSIERPFLGSAVLLGRSIDGSFAVSSLQRVVIGFDFGNYVDHFRGEEKISVCSHVRFEFSPGGYSFRNVAVPKEGRDNKWNLFEKLEGKDDVDQGSFIGVFHPWLK